MPTPPPDLVLGLLRSALQPIADAEIQKSKDQLAAHMATLTNQDKSDGRSHIRQMVIIVGAMVLIVCLGGIGVTAYLKGDKTFAASMFSGIFGLLTGGAAGWGLREARGK